MPHKTVWERHGIYWKFHGKVTFQEVLEANDELYRDARFEDHYYQIWDGADIEHLDMGETDPEIPAINDKATNLYKPYLKCALVAKDDAVRQAIRQYIDISTELGSTWDFRLFDNLEEARKWAMA